MFTTPAAVLGTWFRGLLSIAIIAGAIWLFNEWYHRLPSEQPPPGPTRMEDSGPSVSPRATAWQRITRWRPGWDEPTFLLTAAIALTAISVGGRFVTPRLVLRSRAGSAPALPEGIAKTIHQPDGTDLHCEEHGAAQRPAVILTHGWGANHNAWGFLHHQWPADLRLVAWDLPGLGRSTQPDDRNFSLEKLARDLRAVIDTTAEGQPVVLMGHSIGGMTILTLCRLFPELLASRVKGLVLVHTTYTNPLRTMIFSGLMTALQKPLIEPLLYLQIGLSPLVRVMNWLSYWNGSLHWSAAWSSFGGSETREQLDFVAQFQLHASPAVVARGALGMLKYDATSVLPAIHVPVLVVAADRDPVTLPEASRFIQNNVPAAELQELRPARHYGLLEHQSLFCEATLNFCRRLLPSELHPQLRTLAEAAKEQPTL